MTTDAETGNDEACEGTAEHMNVPQAAERPYCSNLNRVPTELEQPELTGLPFTSNTVDEPSVVNSSPLAANTKAPAPSCFPAKAPVETLRR